MGVAGVSLAAAGIAVAVAQLELGGRPQAHIWSNAWLDSALGLAGVGVLIAGFLFVFAVFQPEARITRPGDQSDEAQDVAGDSDSKAVVRGRYSAAGEIRREHGKRKIFRGNKQTAPIDLELAVIYVWMSPFVLLGGALLIAITHRTPWLITGAALILAVAGFYGILYWRNFGVRTHVSVSADGVTFSGRRSGRILRDRFQARWNDVIDVGIIRTYRGSEPWLVAEVPPDSALMFRSASSRLVEPKRNLIMICNLREVGIQEHQITAALDYWRPEQKGFARD